MFDDDFMESEEDFYMYEMLEGRIKNDLDEDDPASAAILGCLLVIGAIVYVYLMLNFLF